MAGHLARLRGVAASAGLWRRFAVLGSLIVIALLLGGASDWVLVTAAALAGLPALIDTGHPPATATASPSVTLIDGGAPRPETRGALLSRLASTTGHDPPAPPVTRVAIALRLDQPERLRAALGSDGYGALFAVLADRLGAALRSTDSFCLLEGEDAQPTGFGVALVQQPPLDQARVRSMIRRLQAILAEPVEGSGRVIRVSLSAGFCLSARAAALSQGDMLAAAEDAATRAMRDGDGAIGSFGVVDFPGILAGGTATTLRHALDDGQIRPDFQPQLCLATGRVSGIEARLRWHHPERGIIPATDVLPQIAAEGLSMRCTQALLRAATEALAGLDMQGLHVPSVSVNLAAAEMRCDGLADNIAWELDRADLGPGRLFLKIPHTLLEHRDDDEASRNMARLAAMGCRIDLANFGIGRAPLSAIRHCAVTRLTIDRSLVTGLVGDKGQHRLVSAILSMAAQLGLSTLAEGVETAAQRRQLTRMGCGAVQGKSIATAMPAETLAHWIRTHEASLATPPDAHRSKDAGEADMGNGRASAGARASEPARTRARKDSGVQTEGAQA